MEHPEEELARVRAQLNRAHAEIERLHGTIADLREQRRHLMQRLKKEADAASDADFGSAAGDEPARRDFIGANDPTRTRHCIPKEPAGKAEPSAPEAPALRDPLDAIYERTASALHAVREERDDLRAELDEARRRIRWWQDGHERAFKRAEKAEADAARLREALLRARKMLGLHSLHADAEGFAIIGAALAATTATED